jgi:hypothetical protein
MTGQYKFLVSSLRGESLYHGVPSITLYDSHSAEAPVVKVVGPEARAVHTQIMCRPEGPERSAYVEALYKEGCAQAEENVLKCQAERV